MCRGTHTSDKEAFYLQIAPFLIALICLTFFVSACRMSPDNNGQHVKISFSDFADYQRGNVTTDLISRKEDVGLDLLGEGWWRGKQDGKPTDVSNMGREWAELSFFSAGGDTSQVNLQCRLKKTANPAHYILQIRLNGRLVGKLPLRDGWHRLSQDLPPHRVKQGRNSLALRLKAVSEDASKMGKPVLEVNKLAFRTSTGRPARTEGLFRISCIRNGAGKSKTSLIDMPTDGYLDLITEVPREARWVAGFEVRYLRGETTRPVTVLAEIVDKNGMVHELYRTAADKRKKTSRRMRIDLSEWSGRLVRLRLRTSGQANAVVRFKDPQIEGLADSSKLLAVPPPRPRIPPRSGRLARPDVFFILLDAARADALSCYGGIHATPAIDNLASAGTRFEKVLAPASWTGQSIPAILTGLYPDSMGIAHWGNRLPSEFPLAPEFLSRIGYHTVLWSQHHFYKGNLPLQRGFEGVFFSPSKDHKALPEPQDLLVEDKPTFAFIHLLPPHNPYEPPEPFRGAYSAWYRGDISVDARFLNRFPHNERPGDLHKDDVRYIRDRYLENMAFADSLVGRVIDMLKKQGRYDRAMIVILSDHGEAFLEHDRFLHTKHLYREFIHVPLIIKWPAGVEGFEPVVKDTVSLVDLVPTLLDGLGSPDSDARFQGDSLLPLIFDGARPERIIYSTTRGVAHGNKPARSRVAFERGKWKVIHTIAEDRTELYSIDDDPKEKHDLAPSESMFAQLLNQTLMTHRALNESLFTALGAQPEEEEMGAEVEQQLRALGYF
ncbi:sulfatase [Acidobacteriota bacterium]